MPYDTTGESQLINHHGHSLNAKQRHDVMTLASRVHMLTLQIFNSHQKN